MMIDTWTSVQKVMEETGLSADDILKMDMSEYGRLTGRQSPAEAATAALDAAYPASAPQGQEQPPGAVQQPADAPQSVSDAEFMAWRAGRVRGGEGKGIFDSVPSRSAEYADGVRRHAGRTMYGQSNVVEPPRLEGRTILKQDVMRDMRSAADRFSTPGNAFGI